MFRRKTELDRRLKRIEKELTSVHSNLRTLSRTVDDAGAPGRRAGVLKPLRPAAAEGPVREGEGRLADYLATTLQAGRPLRHERRIQRNKAIVMLVFVLLVLLWVLHRFFL